MTGWQDHENRDGKNGLCRTFINETERNNMSEIKTIERVQIRASEEEIRKF